MPQEAALQDMNETERGYHGTVSTHAHNIRQSTLSNMQISLSLTASVSFKRLTAARMAGYAGIVFAGVALVRAVGTALLLHSQSIAIPKGHEPKCQPKTVKNRCEFGLS